MKPREIDWSLIPPMELRLLCETIIEEAEKYYKDPASVKKFEEWKRKKDEQSKKR